MKMRRKQNPLVRSTTVIEIEDDPKPSHTEPFGLNQNACIVIPGMTSRERSKMLKRKTDVMKTKDRERKRKLAAKRKTAARKQTFAEKRKTAARMQTLAGKKNVAARKQTLASKPKLTNCNTE